MYLYEEMFTIRECECDENHLIRLSSLWDMMQIIASKNADQLGFGFKEMTERGIFWVLNRMQVIVKRYPKFGETIRVTTEPAGVSSLFAIRKYHAYDSDDNELMSSVSMWVILDIATMKLKRPSVYGETHDIFAYEYTGDLPQKLSSFVEATLLRSIRAEYSDIDVNQHVNNSRYINWVENLLMPDLNGRRINEISVNYLSQTKIGDILDAYLYHDENKYLIELKNESKNVFIAECKV